MFLTKRRYFPFQLPTSECSLLALKTFGRKRHYKVMSLQIWKQKYLQDWKPPAFWKNKPHMAFRQPIPDDHQSSREPLIWRQLTCLWLVQLLSSNKLQSVWLLPRCSGVECLRKPLANLQWWVKQLEEARILMHTGQNMEPDTNLEAMEYNPPDVGENHCSFQNNIIP